MKLNNEEPQLTFCYIFGEISNVGVKFKKEKNKKTKIVFSTHGWKEIYHIPIQIRKRKFQLIAEIIPRENRKNTFLFFLLFHRNTLVWEIVQTLRHILPILIHAFFIYLY